jgi:hypothetical protein
MERKMRTKEVPEVVKKTTNPGKRNGADKEVSGVPDYE